ncbi:MAG TPA: T9SS type A sorting domain-containing protein [Chitinophagales bacterium]|nr:T9SS type A sorting domain-containing protein [Chitinophagales bacterium]
MKTFYSLVLLPLLCIIPALVHAQCTAGETPVTIQIETDDYGYEGYWALYPDGSSCGAGNIASGGNATQVGCNGAGQQDASMGFGYGNNQTYTSGPHCLTSGAAYHIKYVDDYNDGGFDITVLIEGLPLYEFDGNGNNSIFTFEATPALELNAGLIGITTAGFHVISDVPVSGKIFNYGSATITSISINYSINGGNPVSQNLSGLSILPYGEEYEFTSSYFWYAQDTGTYTLKVWTSNVNGETDMDTSNDTLQKTIVIGTPVPDLVDQYLEDTLTFTVIGDASDGLNKPRDLDFHPTLTKYELWVINEDTENSGGSTVTFYNAGKGEQTELWKRDGNAWHFMSLPTAIAFSENTNFATSTGVYDANHGTGHFTGPALWSSDMSIYAEPSGGNGSHLDMIHQSPYSMGIAAERDNAFWVFDGDAGNIVRYDFRKDHGPGNDDHRDGLVWRYTEVQVQKLNNAVPSHLVLDEQKKWLYIVDGGNQRVLRMDITTGHPSANLTPYAEPLAEYKRYSGVTWEAIITTGLSQPCGIDIMGDRLLVSDYSNGDIIIYDISLQPVVELGRIHTGQPGIQGIKIGPDGLIWYVNRTTNEVVRIEGPKEETPVNTAISEENHQPHVSISPNPADEKARIAFTGFSNEKLHAELFDLAGRSLFRKCICISGNSAAELDLNDYPPGSYFMVISSVDYTVTKKIFIQR